MAKETKIEKALVDKKVLVNLDKIGGHNHLVSIELTEDIKNGSVVKLGDYAGQDFYKGIKPVALADDRLVFIAASILPYDIRTNIEDVVLKAGERVRAYILQKGDIITITNDGITGVTAINQFVSAVVGAYELKAGIVKADAFNFVVIAKEKLKGLDATVLEVI